MLKYAYYLSVCGSLNSTATSSCLQVMGDSSAYQLDSNAQGLAVYDIGNWDTSSPPHFQYINASEPKIGVQYTMIGAPQWSAADTATCKCMRSLGGSICQPAD